MKECSPPSGEGVLKNSQLYVSIEVFKKVSDYRVYRRAAHRADSTLIISYILLPYRIATKYYTIKTNLNLD